MNILVVDDAKFIHATMRAFVAGTEFSVSAMASNAKDAIDYLKSNNPDAVTLDITMPGMNGLECLKIIRSMKPELPVIVVSALSDSSTALQALQLGARAFILKPFTQASLVANLRKIQEAKK